VIGSVFSFTHRLSGDADDARHKLLRVWREVRWENLPRRLALSQKKICVHKSTKICVRLVKIASYATDASTAETADLDDRILTKKQSYTIIKLLFQPN
jgi:hypothetical protein